VRQLEIDARANPPADVERDEELVVASLKSMNRLLWDVMMKCSNMMKHPLINKQHGLGGYLSGSPEQPQVPSTRA
jgi:hypothetical protein